MKVLLQRVQHASVAVADTKIAHIDYGLLLFLGVHKGDNKDIAIRLANRVLSYRVFPDTENKMNLNVQQAKGGLLVVSQFTLVADTGSGTRPSFTPAASPEMAMNLYSIFIDHLQQFHANIQSGQFAADMQVSLVNDGPVTFLLELSK